jgi:hypothetical protein
MRFTDMDTISPEVVLKVQELVTSGECTLAGVSKRRIDMTVPFIVRFSPAGRGACRSAQARLCKAEGVLAGAVLGLLKAGTFKPTGKNLTGWYRSELSFASS